MVYQFIQLILIVLAACTPFQTQEIPLKTDSSLNQTVLNESPKSQINIPEFSDPIVQNVRLTGKINANFGFTKDSRLRMIEKNGEKWEFIYQKGKLVEIKGPSTIEFFYDQGKISQIKSSDADILFHYDQAQRLSHITGGRETIYFSYDTTQNLRTVNRGVAGETAFNYDKFGNVKQIEKGKRTTTLYYDDKNRVRQFDGDETQLILGYFKDDKLVSITGNIFGQGLAVSYGPAIPPLEAKIIYGKDQSVFTSSDTIPLYIAVDDYLYCNYMRRLPELIFDGTSYAFYHNYYNGTITDYLIKHFTCIPHET